MRNGMSIINSRLFTFFRDLSRTETRFKTTGSFAERHCSRKRKVYLEKEQKMLLYLQKKKRKENRLRLLIVLVLVVEVKRDYRVFFTESPPPTKTRETVEHEAGIAFTPELLDKVQDRVQRLFRASIIRTNADVAAEVEHRRFLARV